MENPYQEVQSQSAGNEVFQKQQGAHGISATTAAQTYLFSSKGWVRFISVLLFIYFAFMVMATFGVLAFASKVGGVGILMGLLMLVMTVVMFLLANGLSKYSSAITRTEISRNPGDLEAAIIHQMKFWKLAGILTLIGLVMTILGLFAPAALGGM